MREGSVGGVRRELVPVCSRCSSRSLFYSGIFGFFIVDAVGVGTLFDFLLGLRTLHVWRADMGPFLRSVITACLVFTMARVISVTCQEDIKKGQ